MSVKAGSRKELGSRQRAGGQSAQAHIDPTAWRQQIRKELLQRVRPSQSHDEQVSAGRVTGAAVGPHSGEITSHDFLANSSWGFEEGGWECEAGEGGESKMSPTWLGGDRLAVTGLRSDGKKPSLLAQRYPRATSCIGMCEDGLTELGELSGYNQTVKYDKRGQIRREVTKVGAKSDRLTLGTKEWKTTYDLSCAAGLARSQIFDEASRSLAGQSRRHRLREFPDKFGSRRRCVSGAEGRHASSEFNPDSPSIHIISGPGHTRGRGCLSKLDFDIQDLACALRHQGRVHQVEGKGPQVVKPPSYLPSPSPHLAVNRCEASSAPDGIKSNEPAIRDSRPVNRVPSPVACALESWSKRLRK